MFRALKADSDGDLQREADRLNQHRVPLSCATIVPGTPKSRSRVARQQFVADFLELTRHDIGLECFDN